MRKTHTRDVPWMHLTYREGNWSQIEGTNLSGEIAAGVRHNKEQLEGGNIAPDQGEAWVVMKLEDDVSRQKFNNLKRENSHR